MAWLALFVSFIAPGTGQMLLGHFSQAVVYGTLFAVGKSVVLPLVLRGGRVSSLRRTLQVFYLCNCCYIGLIFFAAAAAFFQANSTQQMHPFAALLFALCVGLVKKRTENKFIFTALCGRSGVWEILEHTQKSPTGKNPKNQK